MDLITTIKLMQWSNQSSKTYYEIANYQIYYCKCSESYTHLRSILDYFILSVLFSLILSFGFVLVLVDLELVCLLVAFNRLSPLSFR